ncbi:hypothetical protein GCM10010975_06630 [Comamonas phosphati]|nr:hypothetical protein GCM10010975_06630 [Comamonas phosphati]
MTSSLPTSSAPGSWQPDAVLTQWFGSARPGNASALAHQAQWFTKSPEFDAQLRERFGAAVQAALGGQLNHWATQGPWQCLALILLLDQFTRNIHRGTPQSFAGDPQALALALEAQARGFDLELPEVTRIFMYLPLEHAEDLAMQQRSVACFDSLARMAPDADSREFLAGTLDYALRHQEVIARFGRFPHRNPILGRSGTPAEQEYLAQPGAGF